MTKSKRITANMKRERRQIKKNYYSSIDKEKHKEFLTQEKQRMEEVLLKKAEEKYEDNLYSEENAIKFYRIGNTIHDKSCIMLSAYSEDEKVSLERYDRTLCQCDMCSMRSYIRIGTDDFSPIKFYEKVFLSNHIDVDYLGSMFLRGMTIEAKDYALLIHFNADNWKIIFDKDVNGIPNLKKPVLWHNNYYIINNKREIVDNEYHLQLTGKNLKECLSVIETYSFDIHRKKAIEEREKEQADYQRLCMIYNENKIKNVQEDIKNISDKYSKEDDEEKPLSLENIIKDLNQLIDNTNQNPDSSLFDILQIIANIKICCDDILSKYEIAESDCEHYITIKKLYNGKENKSIPFENDENSIIVI